MNIISLETAFQLAILEIEYRYKCADDCNEKMGVLLKGTPNGTVSLSMRIFRSFWKAL